MGFVTLRMLLIPLLSFLIGSIPTAYLIVKRRHGKDLRNEGSGNIGTLNAYEVTGSKSVGKIVLLIDLVKGAVPVLLAWLVFGGGFIECAVALGATVLGHNYSPWIGFKGGRGLAPAAGGALAFNPFFVITWGALWAAFYLPSKNVHIGNIAATVLTPILVWLLPGVTRALSLHPYEQNWMPVVVAAGFCLLIFIKHIKPLRDMMAGKGKKVRGQRSEV